MRKVEQALDKLMYRASCPPAERLADYVMKTLTVSDRDTIDQHLPTCKLCRDEVGSLQSILIVDDALPEPIQEPLLQRVKSFFQMVEDQFVRILTPLPKLAYGQLKGSDDPGTRVLSFGSGPVSVMMSVEKALDGVKINGSIVDTGETTQWAEGHVELVGVSAEQKRYLAHIDEDDMFTFESIVPGQYHLSVYAIDGEVLRLENLELKF